MLRSSNSGFSQASWNSPASTLSIEPDRAMLFKKGVNSVSVSVSPGAVPLRRGELVKFALRVQRCCAAVNADVSTQGGYVSTVQFGELF